MRVHLSIDADLSEGMEMTACRRLWSTSSLRRSLCARDAPNRTPSGTMHAQRPPASSIRKKSATKSSSVFVVLTFAVRLPAIFCPSSEPLNGGFARTSVYLSVSVLFFERASLNWMSAPSMPCRMVFIAVIRSMV